MSDVTQPAAAAVASVRLLVNLFAIGTPVALSAAAALRLSSAGPPRLRYLLAVGAFAVAALAPIAATVAPGAGHGNRSEAAGAEDRSWRPGPTVTSALERGTAATYAELASSRVWATAALFLWLAGAALLVGRELAGHARLRLARRGWRDADGALRTRLDWPAGVPLKVDERGGPSTVGLLRPAVVLPAGLADAIGTEAARRVARHELAHARWRDPLAVAILRFLRALLWPSAPLWLLERVVHLEREVAADWAAAVASSERPASAEAADACAAYAASLLAVARRFEARGSQAGTPQAASHAGACARLEERVRRLLSASARPSRSRALAAAALLIVGAWGIGAAPVASDTLTAPGAGAGDSAVTGGDGRVRVDNHADAPVRIESAQLPRPAVDPGAAADPLGGRLLGLPVVRLRNASARRTSDVVVAIWNGDRLDARIRARVSLGAGATTVVDPATGSPNVFSTPRVREATVRVLEVGFADGTRWRHPDSPSLLSTSDR